MWIIIILISIIALIILLWQISNFISVFFGCPYVKTKKDTVRKVLKLAAIKKGDIFYDLGSGNGDVLIEASKLGAKCIGYEISPYYYIVSKLRTMRFKNIDVRFQNINDIDLQKADIVYVYLIPKFLKKLSPKFQRELKPGAKIISIGFPIKNSTFSARVKMIDNHLVYFCTKKSAA
jgi:SAM-dependent methyltransferase